MKKTLLFLVTVFCFGSMASAQDGAKTSKQKNAATSGTAKTLVLPRTKTDEKARIAAKKQHFESIKSKAAKSATAAETVNK